MKNSAASQQPPIGRPARPFSCQPATSSQQLYTPL